MDKKQFLDRITDILNELDSQLKTIKKGDYHEVELDLFAANAVYLAEHAKVYTKLLGEKNKNRKREERIKQVEQKFPNEADLPETHMEESQEMEEPISAPSIEPNAHENPDDVVNSIERNLDEHLHANAEPFFEEGDTNGKNSTLEFEDRLMQPISDAQSKEESPRLNEKFQVKGDTVYDKITAQHQQLAAKQVPISNLNSGIGLNERFYFAKSLFNGNISNFEQSLSNLDNCSSLGEALEYVDANLVKEYAWENKEEDSRRFYDLLKRRFM